MVKFDIIEFCPSKSITSEHVMWLSIIITICICFLYILSIVSPNLTLNITLIITTITPILTRIYGEFEWFPKDFKLCNNLELTSNSMKIGNSNIDLKSIKQITINVNDWRGKKIVRIVRAYSSGPSISQGVNNEIIVQTVDESLEVKFRIESESHFKELGLWLSSIYDSDILISEKYQNIKSYGLQHLNFVEIQKFKRKYIT